jgi:hypothetical protein
MQPGLCYHHTAHAQQPRPLLHNHPDNAVYCQGRCAPFTLQSPVGFSTAVQLHPVLAFEPCEIHKVRANQHTDDVWFLTTHAGPMCNVQAGQARHTQSVSQVKGLLNLTACTHVTSSNCEHVGTIVVAMAIMLVREQLKLP